jgi:hypothetical protein
VELFLVDDFRKNPAARPAELVGVESASRLSSGGEWPSVIATRLSDSLLFGPEYYTVMRVSRKPQCPYSDSMGNICEDTGFK